MAREKWDNDRIKAEVERDKKLRQYQLGPHNFTMLPMPEGAKVDVQYSAERDEFGVTVEQDGETAQGFIPSESLNGTPEQNANTMQRMIQALLEALERAAKKQQEQKDGKGGKGESKQKQQKKQEDKQPSKDEWWQVLQTNLTGVFHTAGYT